MSNIEYSVKPGSEENKRSQINTILQDIKRSLGTLGGDVDYVTRQELISAINNIPIPSSGLSAVTTDSTLTGDGTGGSPLGVDIPGVISADIGNDLTIGGDGLLFVPPTGIEVSLGSGDGQGPILPTNTPFEVVVPRGYVLNDGWKMMCKPSGSITVDIRRANFPAIPNVGDSITGGAAPAIVASTDNSGTLLGWTTTIVEDSILQIIITANTGVRWFSLKVR